MISPRVFQDARGHFFESFQLQRYQQAGINLVFVQDNYSHSSKNTLRGLHYQLQHAQDKLVGVFSGTVFDVVVDVRVGSPTFGKWMGTVLSAENAIQLFIPKGFAHGFCVLSETAGFYYKCTDYYAPGDEYGVAWNDPALQIAWPLDAAPVVSTKDQLYLPFNQIPEKNFPRYKTHAV